MSSVTDLADALLKGIGANNDAQAVEKFIDTGFPPLNKILSGRYDGGLPFGRMVEMFGESSTGKTALATEWMVRAQGMGGVAGFIDWERSFDVHLAEGFGLKTDRPYWIYAKPKTWEEGNMVAAKACQLIRASKAIPDDAPILFVFDSIAAALPKSVSEKALDELTMNDTTALARVTSTTLKSMAHFCEEFNATFLYLNQMRLKPGVCLRYDTPVTLADGTQEKIGKLVHDRKPVEVLTVDVETRQVKAQKIEQFHRNPHDGKWIQVVTTGGKNGKRSAFLTPEHQVLTPAGWVRADKIKLGDRVSTVDMRYYTEDQHRVILGSLLGDGQIRFGDGKNPLSEKGRLRLVHGQKQHDYLSWKCSLLGLDNPKKTALHSYSDSKSSIEFSRYLPVKKFKAVLEIPDAWIVKIDPLVAAIWFMDDGHYSAEHGGLKYGEGRYSIAASGLSLEALEKVALTLEAHGMGRATCKQGKGLFWSGAEAALFGSQIAKFVPMCMSHKLNRKLTAAGDQLTLGQMLPTEEVYSNVVIKVAQSQGDKALDGYKYDLGISDTHTFVAGGGIVVHNCYGDPRTTPGGKAMEFYASGRLALGRTKIMDTVDGEKTFVGQSIAIQCVKSKFTKPFGECAVRMSYDDLGVARFDMISSLLDYLVDKKLVEYAKPRVTWTDGKKYFVKELARKLTEEDAYDELLALLPK